MAWKPVICGIPQKLLSCVNNFINNPNNRTAYAFNKFADDTTYGFAAMQRNIHKLKKWTEEPHEDQQLEMSSPASG